MEKKASDILALMCVIFGGTGLCVASNYAVHSCPMPPPLIVATSGVKPLEPYFRADLSTACSDNNLQSNFAAFNTVCKAHAFVKIVVNDFPSKNPNFEWDNICDKSRNKANEYI